MSATVSAPPASPSQTSADAAGLRTLDLPVAGMTCAACATRLEKVLNRLPGVDASVNLAAERARVSIPPELAPAQVLESIRKAGFEVPAASAELAIGGMTLGNLWIWSRPERPVPPCPSQTQHP